MANGFGKVSTVTLVVVLSAILVESFFFGSSVFQARQVYADKTFVKFHDNFNNGKISSKFTIATNSGISVTETKGFLRIQGSSTTPLAAGQAELNRIFTASSDQPAIATTTLRLGDIAQDFGSTARIELVQDPDNFLVFGMLDPSGVYYQQKQGAGTLTQTLVGIPRDSEFHDYRVEYDGNSARLFFDNAQVATVNIELDGFEVWLQAHTYHVDAGAVIGEFDNFRVRAPLA